jgi:TetR/AcrR family transcriptional repressor of nem operon
MIKHAERDTREHILNTGEQLCLKKGFTGMGLSELLKTAGVPKGSFYHYFPSKEAFGVSMLERYYAQYDNRLTTLFGCDCGDAPEVRVIRWFENAVEQFRQQTHITGCLAVKLSAEVCDLSEAMRASMEAGSCKVQEHLARTIEQAKQSGAVSLHTESYALAQVLYSLWLGANLQAKTGRSVAPLENALAHVKQLFANKPD